MKTKKGWMSLVLALIALSALAIPTSPALVQDAGQIAGKPAQDDYVSVIKTYTLRYIDPRELLNLAKLYVLNSTASGNIITIQIHKINIPDFEALLRKVDVEKKSIQFRIYTILASRETPEEGGGKTPRGQSMESLNPEARKVLDELKGLWNFKSYRADNPSFLVVKDGAGSSFCRLVSDWSGFDLHLQNPQINGDEPGKRTIHVGEIQLRQTLANGNVTTLIATSDVTFKENGWLVVGVSGLAGPSAQALILVLGAEIK